MAIKSPIPTVDILPPMTPRVRDVMYGVLSWAAGILPIVTGVLALWPDVDVSKPLLAINTVVLGLWSLGGFKAKGAVSDVTA